MQTDNDLDAVTVADHAVGTQLFESIIRCRQARITQRYAQPGGAVVQAVDIFSATECRQNMAGNIMATLFLAA